MGQSLLRDSDNPDLLMIEIDHHNPGPIDGWSSGYFWWDAYNTPAYVTVVVGAAGDICFPIYCRWGDGYYWQMFTMRYDRVHLVLEILLVPTPESSVWGVEGEPQNVVDIDVHDEEFQPDVLFSQLMAVYGRSKLLEPVQALFLGSERDDAPEHVWRPVDVGQGSAAVLLVTDEETGLADLIAEERARQTQ